MIRFASVQPTVEYRNTIEFTIFNFTKKSIGRKKFILSEIRDESQDLTVRALPTRHLYHMNYTRNIY